MSRTIEPDQNEVFAFLQDPKTHPGAGSVTRIDTHGAAVFLAGPDVYKVKRSVRFPFMDFSSLAKRRAACEAEIEVNRGNAPDLYLGVVPITREDGKLRLGGAGEPVEWAVHLRRFDESATLDRLAEAGPLGPALIDKLARAVVAAHARAPIRDGEAATRIFRRLMTETTEELEAGPFPADRVAAYCAALAAETDRVEALLLDRGRHGQVRHCHGDLHLGNLVLIDDEPVLFDAIEFDPAIAISDVLYDLAFLLMDLCERGLRADANRLLNRYLSLCPDMETQIDGLAALPLFMSLRAAIRAKVMAVRLPEQAQAYFQAALDFLAGAPPLLVAVGGLSGAGKSTLAAALAPCLGRAPGALHLRSDVERKRLFGVAETVALPADAYRPSASQAVRHRLAALADRALRAGQAVIVDATHLCVSDRTAIEALAERLGVGFHGLWLDAPVDTLTQRVAGRVADASDATAEVVRAQAARPRERLPWHRLDATQQVEEILREARRLAQDARAL
jgi:aminoglycoside phosphotransferase family enzyme/predicted kinase